VWGTFCIFDIMEDMKKVFSHFFALAMILSFFVSFIPVQVFAETVEEREARLKAELAQVEKEIAQQQAILQNKQRETASIERDVAILNARIKEQQLKIQARNIEIQRLGKDITRKNETIGELNAKIDRSKESLAQLIRKTNEIDDFSLVEVVLSNENVSDFFTDLDSFESIKLAMQSSFEEIRDTKNQAEVEKELLSQKQNEETDAKKAIEVEKQKVEANENEKKKLLSINKEQERAYESVLAERQRKAAEIRAALFALRDTSSIQFGQALEYANEAFQITGVRPAFLLGILKQESNIGQNVGSCVITDLESGTTQSVNSGNSFANGIHPTRDLPLLQTIVTTLGRDPASTKVSCPLSVGYGGAMGPAQFIPSTWNAYIPRLQQTFGVYPDPWNPRHAFIASATFLADLGAARGGYSAEHEAAARYYAGGNWASLGQGYANSVLNHAQTIQTTMIDPLQGL